MQDTRTVDCLVVGAGPAGLTAGLYLRRFLRSVVVADNGHSRARAIARSHNVPWFPQGISGQDLLRLLREQLQDVQGEVTAAEVTGLQHHPQGGFVAQTEGLALRARAVLLATGVVDAVPALPGIEAVMERGLLRQCPICDGYEHRERRILVLGDGPHAASEADFIAHYSPHVLRVGMLQLPDAASRQVQVLPALAAWVALPPAGGVRIGLADGSVHDVDVAYAALGVQPRSRLGSALGAEVDATGNLVIDAHGATSVKGVFAAGDVASGLDQLAVAAGQAAVAATAIHQLLRQPSA